MKRFQKTMKRILLVGIFLPFVSFAQTHRAYADELFKKADYYHAFFLYRNLYGTDLNENQFAQRCNQAMKLTKEFLDLRSTKQYYDAKTRLRELLELNPDDFHAPILPQMSIEEANYWQRLAPKQNSAKEINLMLEKAIALYEQGKADGWKPKDIDEAIKICELSKVDSGIAEVLPQTAIIAPTKVEIEPTIQATKIEDFIVPPKVDSTEKPIPTEIKVVKTKARNFMPRKEIAANQK